MKNKQIKGIDKFYSINWETTFEQFSNIGSLFDFFKDGKIFIPKLRENIYT